MLPYEKLKSKFYCSNIAFNIDNCIHKSDT